MQTSYRCVQLVKSPFHDGRGDLGPQPTHGEGFVYDQQTSGFCYALNDRIHIEWNNRSQIDDLTRQIVEANAEGVALRQEWYELLRNLDVAAE